MSLEAIIYKKGSLKILDQLLLPFETKYIEINNVNEAWDAINKMQVRGAPAIAIVGCLSLAVEMHTDESFHDKQLLANELINKLIYLVSARPTAVNMKISKEILENLIRNLLNDEKISVEIMKERVIKEIENMLIKDKQDNLNIGKFGLEEVLKSNSKQRYNILTHCNTGSLATSGYGTALGIIRSFATANKLNHVYFTETRPYMQGSRLTAYELLYDKIPSTLICDSAVASLFQTKEIDFVVVGADRIAANGDTANKIGTYQIAILANYHKIPFYVAAPYSSIDLSLKCGKIIPIEERSQKEMSMLMGQRISAPGVICWNPAFDVTPAQIITKIITEKGAFDPEKISEN